MIRSRTESSESGSRRAEQIARIVESILRQEDGANPTVDAELERQYPEFVPDLVESLHTARAVHAAAQQARQQNLADRAGGESPRFGDDLLFLDKALDRYEVLTRIDHGGQGVIYKAIHKASNRTVAIKVLLDGPLATERQRHRFEREAHLLSRLRHPNIVTLYDSGVVRGRQFFAMEYIEGLPIDDYVLLNRPPVQDVVHLFVKVCRAISSAHQHGIIHRDLKPTNIFVDLDGEPHVLDFGLAKCIEDGSDAQMGATVSLAGQVPGTLGFLSPEQASGDSAGVDVRSDIYALGLILYQLLVGVPPYSLQGDVSAIRARIMFETPRPLRVAAQDPEAGVVPTTGEISDDLERIILRALAKEKERRYQSVEALADDLCRYLAGEAVEAKADSNLYLLRKTIRKYRVHAAFAAAIFVLLAVSSGLVASLWWRARAEATRAQTQRDNARQTAALAQATLDEVISEFETSIRTLAGGAAVRDRLLQRMSDKLKELQPFVESDVDMEPLTLRLREKQGDIARAQGRTTEAVGHYQAFLEIALRRAGRNAEPPGDATARLAVGRAYRKLAAASEDPERHLRQAIELGEALVEELPASMEAGQELSKARVALAQHFFDTGRFSEAVSEAEAATDGLQRIVDGADEGEESQDVLATAWGLEGRALVKLGNADSGARLLEAALGLFENMSCQRPTDVEVRHKLLIGCVQLGRLREIAGHPNEAATLLEEAVRIGEYLTLVDPTITGWKRDLYAAHHELGRLYLEGSQLAKSEVHCEAAVALAKALQEAEPDNPEWRRIGAFSHIRRGSLLMAKEDLRQAYEELGLAVATLEELSSSSPGDSALLAELASAHDWLGMCAGKLNEAPTAQGHYAAAYAIRQSLLDAQPGVVKREIDVVLSAMKLASWHLRQDTAEDDAAAKTFLDKAETMLNALLDTGRLSRSMKRYTKWKEDMLHNRQLILRHAERRTASTQCAD